ncbi:member of Set1p complex, histone methyl transferase [Mortierella claussenii]|nr:member of Set1p complex, histone methyl transferase [Mortierella claussenii]
MSPLDDQFLAGSRDAVRLWDLRSPNCQGALAILGRPAIAFDPSGLVFAVAIGSILSLYDVKVFDQGPFETAMIGQSLLSQQSYGAGGLPNTSITATQLEFSSDGKNILVTTAGDAHYIVDSYHPSTTRFRLVGHYSGGGGTADRGHHLGGGPSSGSGGDDEEGFQSGGEACWTPDGKCVVSGSRDGSIYIWDVAKAMADQAMGHFSQGLGHHGHGGGSGDLAGNGGGGVSFLSAEGELRPFKVLKAHGTPSHIVAFNPKYLMMVSGSTELAFWEPDQNAIGMDALHDFSKGSRH